MAPMAQELLWARLMRPRVPLVYLDLNHIVAMARVQARHPKAEPMYGRLFDSASRAVAEHRAVFPLSESHVWEIAKIADPKQRSNLADVLEPLTGYQYMLGRVTLAHLEFAAGIAAITGEPSDDLGYPLISTQAAHTSTAKPSATTPTHPSAPSDTPETGLTSAVPRTSKPSPDGAGSPHPDEQVKTASCAWRWSIRARGGARSSPRHSRSLALPHSAPSCGSRLPRSRRCR